MKRYIITSGSSATLDAVLAYIYRKEELENRCGRYAKRVIEGLLELGLIKKVSSKKGTYYFKTERSKNFKAIDFAKEFLWTYHNPELKKLENSKRYIACYDKNLTGGRKLVEVTQAIKNGYV